MKRCKDAVVLGAGLTGLTAARALESAGRAVTVVEKGPTVGGLAQTVVRGQFRFDLGGHRFFTRDARIDGLVRSVLGEECLTVPRSSQIRLNNRYIDYPLKPLNALSGLGPATALNIVLDNAAERLKRPFESRKPVSLEDWVVRNFGRTLFDIYFKVYSEKVWGIGCESISMDWVAQRIQGLSLGKALKNAFFKGSGEGIRSLTDKFLYPPLGIGTLSDRLREDVERSGEVLCNIEVSRIRHEDFRVNAVEVREGSRSFEIEGHHFISTVPLNELVRMLDPRPPAEVLAAAARLRFRDLIVVAVMLDRDRVTDQSWLYFPEPSIPFGRIHEPTNWSAAMAPPGKTLLVAEQFCFRGDEAWNASDEELADRTIEGLRALGLVSRRDVVDTAVLRISRAYPLFEVGYGENSQTIRDYVRRFANLLPAGRGGNFSYYNMDHAMASGLEAAETVLRGAEELGERESSGVPARQSA